tara:strand:- start:4408 stop:6135 length:1728 start_codon:yes stop_codon:yes gene_type:complete
MPYFADRVKTTTTTTGTGALTLSASGATGFNAFPSSLNGLTVGYVIESGSAFEIGTGTYTHSSLNLTRTLRSSSTGSLLNLGSGTHTVFLTPAAQDLQIVEVFSGTSDLPSATDYHGRIYHVHGEGAMYFAHAGNWVKLANSSDITSGVTVHSNQSAMLTDAASASEGSLHYDTGANKLYVKSSSGFFLLATITNATPVISSFSEATGGASANNLSSGGTFTLTAGSNTVITVNATDANLDTLSFSATVTSGTASDVFSSPSFPVSNQSGNTFTLTPASSGGGTVAIRFDVSDGTNIANVTHSFTISFVSSFDIVNASYMSKSFSVSGQESSPKGVDISADGTKMIIAGNTSDDVHYYTLSTAFDVSTASHSSGGDLSPSGSTPVITGCCYSSSGHMVFTTANGTGKVQSWTLSTNYDTSTASSSYTSSTVGSLSSNVIQNPFEVQFKTDGTKMFILDRNAAKVGEFALSTAFDVSTASYTRAYSPTQGGGFETMDFSDDGTKMFVHGYSDSTIYQYNLASAWDLSNVSYASKSFTLNTSDFGTYIQGMCFGDSGKKLYAVGESNDTVYQFSTST